MRTKSAFAGLVLVASLAACGGGGGGSSEAGPAYASPEAMKSKLTSALPLSECSPETRDMDGVLFTQCVDESGGLVRLSVVDVGQESTQAAGLTDMGWKVATGPGWIAAVNSDQATLDKVASRL